MNALFIYNIENKKNKGLVNSIGLTFSISSYCWKIH